MKNSVLCAVIGGIGGIVTSLFGGFDIMLKTLVILMAADYISGLVVAGFFHASNKSKTGTLDSKAGFRGLFKKGMVLVFVLVGHYLDLMIGIEYVRDAIIIGYAANELISLVENAGQMGMPVPEVIVNAIEVLKKKGEDR